MKKIATWFNSQTVDRRDVVAALGLTMLLLGGERLLTGLGLTATGAVLVAIAVWVR
jgi:hypothetical protein